MSMIDSGSDADGVIDFAPPVGDNDDNKLTGDAVEQFTGVSSRSSSSL